MEITTQSARLKDWQTRRRPLRPVRAVPFPGVVEVAADFIDRAIQQNADALRHPTTQEEAAMPRQEHITAEGTRYGVRPRVKPVTAKQQGTPQM